jgi:hypothetical protein
MDEKQHRRKRSAAITSADQNRETIDSMMQRHSDSHLDRETSGERATRRTNEALVAILDDPGEWTGHASGGAILFTADTLRGAVKRAMGYLAADQAISAICLKPDDTVIVFQQQIEHLAQSAG